MDSLTGILPVGLRPLTIIAQASPEVKAWIDASTAMSGSNGSYNIWYEEQISAGKKEEEVTREAYVGTQQDAFEYMTKYWDFFGETQNNYNKWQAGELDPIAEMQKQRRERA